MRDKDHTSHRILDNICSFAMFCHRPEMIDQPYSMVVGPNLSSLRVWNSPSVDPNSTGFQYAILEIDIRTNSPGQRLKWLFQTNPKKWIWCEETQFFSVLPSQFMQRKTMGSLCMRLDLRKCPKPTQRKIQRGLKTGIISTSGHPDIPCFYVCLTQSEWKSMKNPFIQCILVLNLLNMTR